MNGSDLYATLGVSRDAAPEAIKKAWKRLSMKYHPDRNSEPEAEQNFKAIQQAYSVLSDPQKRQYYDRFGTASPHEMPNGGADFGDHFASVFDELFGGGTFGRAGGARRRQQGRDLQIRVELDLQDAVAGSRRKVKINSLAPCASCNGSGSAADAKKAVCNECGGSGQLRHQVAFMSVQETCPRCEGTGRIVTSPCEDCRGEGRVRNPKTVSIDIPPGVGNDDVLRLAGHGEAGRHGEAAGDLLVKIEVRPHPIFSREADNLFCQMPVSFPAAALGGEVQVPTLSGYRTVELPKGIQSGKRIKIRGQGVKGLRSGLPGDLYCTIVVETPRNLSGPQAALLRQLDETLNSDPKKHIPERTGWLAKVKKFFNHGGPAKTSG